MAISEEIKNKRNQYWTVGDVAYLRIVNRKGQDFIVTFDAEDLPKVQRRIWNAALRAGLKVETPQCLDERGKGLSLSRFVNNTPEGLNCRNLDGNPLNARKANLENLTHSECQKRSKKARLNHCPYPYVTPVGKRYRATYYRRSDNVRFHVGTFDTPEKARDAREEWIKNNADKL